MLTSNQRLIRALIISSALNVILLGYSTYSWVKERPPIPYYVLKPIEEKKVASADASTNEVILRQFKTMSLEQLVSKLHNQELVENGYFQKDLALGCLTTYHHFNLQRALMGLPTIEEQRSLSFHSICGNKEHITVYPGITESQFQAIIQYASTEQWPFTSKGLFLLFQKPEYATDISLEEAVSLTPEFQAVETLFTRSEANIEKKELLTLLREGGWEPLTAFTEQQKMSQDLSPARRQHFLQDYLLYHSKTAAQILLRTDFDFCCKKLDDQSVITLLRLMSDKTRESEKFAQEMLKSPRSNAVWQEAALRLFAFAGENLPPTCSRNEALARFCPQFLQQQQQPKKIIAPPSPPPIIASTPKPKAALKPKAPLKPIAQKPPMRKDHLYIVQDGDSLWKIAKRFNVDIDILRRHNRLSTDFLKPGTPLRIPA